MNAKLDPFSIDENGCCGDVVFEELFIFPGDNNELRFIVTNGVEINKVCLQLPNTPPYPVFNAINFANLYDLWPEDKKNFPSKLIIL